MTTVILGGGLAGLTAALSLTPSPIILVVASSLGSECSSAWAQGGVAAALGSDDNSALHAQDTHKAGAGLCDDDMVQRITQDAHHVIQQLVQRHVMFDRAPNGDLRFGLEAAHSRRRIVHANGDATGAAIMKALVDEVKKTPSIQVLERTRAITLRFNAQGISGVDLEKDGTPIVVETNSIVLATGGAGALWQYTTNPMDSWGSGLALAARAGALLGDLEFMQFHPTAISKRQDPMPLASETLRGEGAYLIDEAGYRFMEGQGNAELEPRDVVARAIFAHQAKNHQVFLDTRDRIGNRLPQRFPAFYQRCLGLGLDPLNEPIPVAPAAHYHMGGVVTDERGRTSVKGLWACGEVACTGLHGANRLASNSLLEAASMGQRVAEDIKLGDFISPPSSLASVVCAPHLSQTPSDIVHKIRKVMSDYVGVMRHAKGLTKALEDLLPLVPISNMALSGALIACAALRREESRGAQARVDFPSTSSQWEHRQILTLHDVMPGTKRQSHVGVS